MTCQSDCRKTRSRKCTNPAPANGGNECYGSDIDSSKCTGGYCVPIDGGWSDWGAHSACKVVQNACKKTRSRTCTNPVPDNGGTYCEGDTSETTDCLSGGCGCSNGWTYFKSRCYLYRKDPQTWVNANNECKIIGSLLASITDSEVHAFVKSLISEENWWTWIGGFERRIDGSIYPRWYWYWADLTAMSYSNWAPGQPDSLGECALLHHSTRLWYDYPCDHINSFVCSKPSG